MKNWKMIGLVTLASAAVLTLVGAGGRSSNWAAPEGQARVEVVQSAGFALADSQASADAYRDNGPGCDEAALSR
jgi:hypothetical protein